MTDDLKPRTSGANGQLWGTRARDWAEIQEGTVRPVYQAVLEKTEVGPGIRYLDVGCGAGMAAQMADVRGAQVAGIDAAEPLLEIARSRAPNAEFRLGDLEELPFADDTFDVVTGFNSFQYAGNPVVALSEAARVTRPNGTIVIMTWGSPEGMEAAAMVGALRTLAPPPPAGSPGPFALSGETALRSFVTDAGLTTVDIFDVDSPFSYPDEATAIRGWQSAGVAARVMQIAGEEAVADAYRTALTPFRQSDGSIRIEATFRCLRATP